MEGCQFGHPYCTQNFDVAYNNKTLISCIGFPELHFFGDNCPKITVKFYCVLYISQFPTFYFSAVFLFANNCSLIYSFFFLVEL